MNQKHTKTKDSGDVCISHPPKAQSECALCVCSLENNDYAAQKTWTNNEPEQAAAAAAQEVDDGDSTEGVSGRYNRSVHEGLSVGEFGFDFAPAPAAAASWLHKKRGGPDTGPKQIGQ